MKHQRYRLPSELPVFSGWRSLLRNCWPLLVLLMLPPAFSYLWHGFTLDQWAGSLIGLAVSMSFASLFWHGLLTRVTECNSKVYQRARQPVRYWLTLAAWLAAYALGTASLLWAGSPS